ncbi:MAG: cox cluster protein [Haloarculaceae archaeon]
MSDRSLATDGDRRDGTDTEGALAGRRLVVGLYLIVVAIAASIGLVLGLIAPQGLDPRLFGVIDLPPTPLGMAAYGGVTLAVVLGVLLVAVAYVSRRYDDADPDGPRR